MATFERNAPKKDPLWQPNLPQIKPGRELREPMASPNREPSFSGIGPIHEEIKRRQDESARRVQQAMEMVDPTGTRSAIGSLDLIPSDEILVTKDAPYILEKKEGTNPTI